MTQQKNCRTLREHLISQLRSALNELESPSQNNDDVTVIFEVAETQFEYDVEQLDQKCLLISQ